MLYYCVVIKIVYVVYGIWLEINIIFLDRGIGKGNVMFLYYEIFIIIIIIIGVSLYFNFLLLFRKV